MKKVFVMILTMILIISMAGCELGSSGIVVHTDDPEDSTRGLTPTSEPTIDTTPQVCQTCDGEGEYICTYCGGNPMCKTCDGEGKTYGEDRRLECPRCHNKPGHNVCKTCGGSGEWSNGRTCGGCLGTGICNYCDRNNENYSIRFVQWSGTCKTCDGTGNSCKHCTDGIMECETCRGSGTILPNPAPNPTPNPNPNPSCPACGGSGFCRYCQGYSSCSNYSCIGGRVTCTTCDGTGDCTSCGGYGKSVYTGKKCTKCGGNGDCTRCHGDRGWTCTTCDGKGSCKYCHNGLCPTCGG